MVREFSDDTGRTLTGESFQILECSPSNFCPLGRLPDDSDQLSHFHIVRLS